MASPKSAEVIAMYSQLIAELEPKLRIKRYALEQLQRESSAGSLSAINVWT